MSIFLKCMKTIVIKICWCDFSTQCWVKGRCCLVWFRFSAFAEPQKCENVCFCNSNSRQQMSETQRWVQPLLHCAHSVPIKDHRNGIQNHDVHDATTVAATQRSGQWHDPSRPERTDHCQDIWRSPLHCPAPSRALPHHWLQQRPSQIWSTTCDDCSARSCKPANTSEWQVPASDTDCSWDHWDTIGQCRPSQSEIVSELKDEWFGV